MNKVLEKSIYHWIMISHGLECEDGPNNCDLCEKYMKYKNHDFSCTKCPVQKVTNGACEGTPYYDWVRHQEQDHYLGIFDIANTLCDQCRILALDEVGFLYSLV